MSAELGLIAVDPGSTIKPINSTPRVKKTVNGKLTDANLEFYNLVSGELVSTTSSDDFSISEDNITINTNTPLFMWVPPVISKNVGESYSRTTYQLQFKPKLRTFNSSLTTVNKWYFEDNTLPTYLLGKINKDSRFYDTALNYTIGLIQPNSDELLEYNLNSIGSEFSNNNTIIGSIDTSTLPAALTNFSIVKAAINIVKAAINMENGTINNIFIIGGKDTSGSPVDTIYVSTLADDGSLGPWVLSSITLPVPLYNASCLFSTSESYLVIVGGNTGSDTYSSDIYSTYTNYFSGDINPFKTNSGILPVGLENAAIATVNISGYQYMVVAGGNNTSPLNSIYVIFTDYGEFNNYGAGYSFSFTLSQTLPFTGNAVGGNITYYTDYGESDTFFILGDDGTNTYIVTFNNNLPSNDSTVSTTQLTMSLNTYKLPYLGPTNKNSLLSFFNNNLMYVCENNGVTSLNYLPLSSIMSETAITGITDISTIESIPLTLPDTISENSWIFNSITYKFYSVGGVISSTTSTDIIEFNLDNNLSYYYVPYSTATDNPLTFIPSQFYFIDPIKVYNLIGTNSPLLTPTEVYNKSITQNDVVYNLGNTILNSQSESNYTEVVSYDPKLNLFTLKLTIYGVENYQTNGFGFSRFFSPFFFIPYFVFNKVSYVNSEIQPTNPPNTVYTIFENLMADTIITGLSLLVEGTYNNSNIDLSSNS